MGAIGCGLGQHVVPVESGQTTMVGIAIVDAHGIIRIAVHVTIGAMVVISISRARSRVSVAGHFIGR